MTRKNAIANIVRQLPAVAALQELWQPRTAEGETEEDYWAFLEWLDAGANRGAPPQQHRALAQRWDWQGRALAFERASGISTGTQQSPEQQIVDGLTTMVQLEVAKLLKRSATEAGEVMTIKDITTTIATLTDLQKASIRAQSEKADLSRLTTDQIQKVLEAQRILREASKK